MTTETQALPILESRLCQQNSESSTYLFNTDSIFADTNSCGNEVLNVQQHPGNVSLGWDDYPAVIHDGGNSYPISDFTSLANKPTDYGICINDCTIPSDFLADSILNFASDSFGARRVEKRTISNFSKVSNVCFNESNHASTVFDETHEILRNRKKILLETTYKRNTSTASKNVAFSTVHVREYDVTLGDHPLAVSYPLSLDWTYNKELNQIYSVDEFDQRRIRRRTLSEDDDDEPIHHRFRGMVFKAFSKPPQLEVIERRSRIATCMQISFEVLDRLERERKVNSLQNC